MSKPTPGPWLDAKNYIFASGGEKGITVAYIPNEANTPIIVALYNAAYQINPSNPQSVAEAIPELVKAMKNLIRSADTYGSNNMGPAKDEARAALAKVEAKP